MIFALISSADTLKKNFQNIYFMLHSMLGMNAKYCMMFYVLNVRILRGTDFQEKGETYGN